jgi:hypothetical protein
VGLANYADLTTEFGVWIENRPTLSARLPAFVAMCEAKMNRLLRVRQMIARASISASSELLAVPADFLALKSMRLTAGDGWELEVITPEDQRDRMGQSSDPGEPQAVAVEGGAFAFWPPQSSATAAEAVYYQQIPGLVANGTNWLMTSHPDAYLYGVVAEGWNYVGDNEEATKFATLFQGALADISAASIRESWSDRLTPQPRATVV